MKIAVWESIRLDSSWRMLVGQEAGGPPGFSSHTRDVALPEPGPPGARPTFSPGPQCPALQGGRPDQTVPQARLPLSCPVWEAEYPAVQGGMPARSPALRPHAADGRGPRRGLRPSTPHRQAGAAGQGAGNMDPGVEVKGAGSEPEDQGPAPRPPRPPRCPDVRPQLVSVSSLHAFGWHPSGVTAPPPALRGPPAQRVLEQRQGHGTDGRASN